MSTETGTETRWGTEPQQAASTTAQGGTTGAASGAGRHRGPVAEHDEATAPRGRHRRQSANS